ncbi:MAG: PQQ-dependent sugar dehydrogenase, partial [Myxococcales bacterium]|nr:PQQ-dependent sugar dehydrogenase [Myxococcales bacterium]
MGCTATPARDLPLGFELEEVYRPLDFPGTVAFAPDGRIFVTELYAGRVRVIENGALAPEPFLEIPDLAQGARQGLLGLALDPDFASNGHVYVYYTQDLGAPGLEPTWRSIQDRVFEGYGCIQCHAGASPPAGLHLTEDESYAALVGAASAEIPSLQRVAPGDPDGSYLVEKLEGAAGISGAVMPPGSWPGLDAASLAAVREWIALGAPVGEAPPPGPTARNRVGRYTDDGAGHGIDPVVILDDIPGADEHNGGPLAFAPDGTLLIQTGENFHDALAQDLGSLGGKILRILPDGGIPADNPFAGAKSTRQEIFSIGHRNGFGIAVDRIRPTPLRVYVSENGPERDDELNLAGAALNFGWPFARGPAGIPGYLDPIYTWPTPVSPTGVAQYDGGAYPPEFAGGLFIGRFNRLNPNISVIERFALDATGSAVDASFAFLTTDLGSAGFVLSVVQGPDDLLYFTTGDGLYRVRYDGTDGDGDGCADLGDPAPEVASDDADGDGYGADCDCNDANAAMSPGNPEVFGNGIDDDC